MGDALRKKFENLDARDDPMLQDTLGAISCRFLVISFVSRESSMVKSVCLQFPGYPANGSSCQVWLLLWFIPPHINCEFQDSCVRLDQETSTDNAEQTRP